MADTAKRLYGPARPATTTATLYTVPGSTTAIIRNIHIANPTGSAATATLGIGADAAGIRLFDAFSVPAGEVLDWSGFLVLAAAEILTGMQGTLNAMTFTVSGVEVT